MGRERRGCGFSLAYVESRYPASMLYIHMWPWVRSLWDQRFTRHLASTGFWRPTIVAEIWSGGGLFCGDWRTWRWESGSRAGFRGIWMAAILLVVRRVVIRMVMGFMVI